MPPITFDELAPTAAGRCDNFQLVDCPKRTARTYIRVRGSDLTQAVLWSTESRPQHVVAVGSGRAGAHFTRYV